MFTYSYIYLILQFTSGEHVYEEIGGAHTDVENHFIMSPSSAYNVFPDEPDDRQVAPDDITITDNDARQGTNSYSYI